MELRGLDRRRRRRLRQADPPLRHDPQEGRPHGGRLDRHQPAGEGRDQQHALLHQGGELHRRALGPAAGHPEQRGRVPRHRGGLPARHGRQRRAARGMRGARPDRLPHDRLHVRRARHDAARPRQGGGRRRQHRHLDRRLRRRAQALHLRRLHLRRLGRASLGGRARRQLAHVRQHGLALDRGDGGRAPDLAARLRVRARPRGRGPLPRRRSLHARLPLQRGRGHAAGAQRPPRPPALRPLWRLARRAELEPPQPRWREPPAARQVHDDRAPRRRAAPCPRRRGGLGRPARARSRRGPQGRAQRAPVAGARGWREVPAVQREDPPSARAAE